MSRLTKENWLDHGLESLAESGFTSLKADKLDKSLSVSRGSFYWHFTDLADFHTAVLHRWLEVSVLAVVEQIESAGTSAADRLEALIAAAAAGTRTLERAVRAWAFSEPSVQEIVAEVDRQRLAYLTSLVEELGVEPAAASRRAFMLYLSSVGYFMLEGLVDQPMEQAVMADIVDLATTV